VIAIDYIEKSKGNLYSRFLYFLFPQRVIKLKNRREELVKQIKGFINKYIGDVDERYRKDRLVNEDEIINESDILIRKSTKRKRNTQINDEIDRFYINFNLLNN
jgi:hypothetical protein